MASLALTRKQTLGLVILLSVILAQAVSEQRFKEEPSDIVAKKGQTLVLVCQVLDRVGEVQWMRDGFGLGDLSAYSRYSLNGAESLGEYNLLIHNAQLEDDAEFECQVIATSNSPALKSRKANVTVHVPPDTPTIVGGPKVRVVAGETTKLTCHARNGAPPPDMTWFSNGVQITENIEYKSVTQEDGKRQDGTSILTIVPRKADQGQEYECRAINAALQEAKYVRNTLNVNYPPEVSMVVVPMKKTQKEHSSMKFTCDATGNPNQITWKWFKGDDWQKGEDKNTYNLASVERGLHNKKITCEASNTVGSTKQSYTLNVIFGPRFHDPPEHVAVNLGDDAKLKCNADGNPDPTILWKKEGTDRILGSSDTLSITDVTEQKLGVYVCMVTSAGFTDISQNVHLMKNDRPEVISTASQSARFGETGVIECKIRSVPKPEKISWTKNGEPLDLSQLKRYQVREEDLPFGKRSLVEIASVQDSDFGDYNCSVENGYGHDAMVITFSKKDVVPLAYILAGVLVGVIIIIVLAVVLFVYHRRKALGGSESGSESSEESLAKKKDLPLEPKVEYTGDTYGSPIDAWRQESSDPKYYRNSVEYDELSYPPKDTRNGMNGILPYDYPDGVGNYGYMDRDYARNPYGTLGGRGVNRVYDSRPYDNRHDGSIYGGPTYGSEYGTYRPPPRINFPSSASDYGPPELNSRLSTNV